MDPHELFRIYPHVTHATAFVELIICEANPGEPESAWDMLLRSGKSPDWVIDALKTVVADEVAIGSPGKHAEALAEMDHPEFRTYICGKMGLM